MVSNNEKRCILRILVYSTVLKNETATKLFLKKPSEVLLDCFNNRKSMKLEKNQSYNEIHYIPCKII